jgi:hypothetical protein
MEYISAKQFAEKYSISGRTARNYCAEGAYLVGKTWNIPAEAVLPKRKNARQREKTALLSILREQKKMKLKGGI